MIADKLLQRGDYSYCSNAPVNYVDEEGTFSLEAGLRQIEQKVKDIVKTIGAEVQLIVNCLKAKTMLAIIAVKQNRYLTDIPCYGADMALFSGVADRYIWFYHQVNHEAPMDYKAKHRHPWWAMGDDTLQFRGGLITLEDYGNINYGYVGKALDIPGWILYAGGGYAAFTGYGAKSGRIDYFLMTKETITILHME